MGSDEPLGVKKLIGEKNPSSLMDGGADLGSISGVLTVLSSCLLILGSGERLGDSSGLTLFFLAFLPGAGEVVGEARVSFTLGVADRSTGGEVEHVD